MNYNKTLYGITAEIGRDEVSFLARLLAEYVRRNRHGDYVPEYNYLANAFLMAEESLRASDSGVAYEMAFILDNNRDVFMQLIKILTEKYGDFECKNGGFWIKKPEGTKEVAECQAN